MITGRGLRSHVPLLPYISLVYGTAAAVLIGIALGTGGQPFGYPPRAYLWFLLLALLPQLIAHSTINWALRYLTAAYVSITLLGEPVASTIWAYFLLDELPGALTLLGGLLILAGIGVASRRPSPALV
jgi:drug/metabolite transporter (DMT)-like permease